jgi:hypothetical protein
MSPANDPLDPGKIVPTITVHRTDQHHVWLDLPVIPVEASR